MSASNNDKLEIDLKDKMSKAFGVLQDQFSGLRTGRATTSLLSPISVKAYGSEQPIDQVGTINVPEPRMLSIQVWDKELVSLVIKAILESGLGLNPSADGNLIRIPIPALTEERRRELTKVAAKYSEDTRIALRNIRRHAMDELKASEKKNEISQDGFHEKATIVQKVTDIFIEKTDDSLEQKNKEIMQV